MKHNKTNSFNHAYGAWKGEKWEWTDKDGKPNHPMDSHDREVVAFYLGFRYSQKEKVVIVHKFKEKYDDIKNKMKQMQKDIRAFKLLSEDEL